MAKVIENTTETMFVAAALEEIEKDHPTAFQVLSEFYYKYAPTMSNDLGGKDDD